MVKVYIVVDVEEIQGVFSTRELANAYISRQSEGNRKWLTVHAWIVDE